MQLVSKIPMDNTYRFMEGDMVVYRFTNPSPNPVNRIELWMRIMNAILEVDIQDDAQDDGQGDAQDNGHGDVQDSPQQSPP
jgi:hypothetical protein